MVRLILIEGIATHIRASFENQRQAALALKVPEGTVSRLCNGYYERFSVATLIALAHQLGANISIQVR